LFDNILLLLGGKVAYRGPISQVENFFTDLGFPTPPKENCADHFMRVLQEEDAGEKIVAEFSKVDSLRSTFSISVDEEPDHPTTCGDILCCFKKPDIVQDLSLLQSAQRQALFLEQVDLYPNSRFHQFVVLFKRASMDSFKDPNKFLRGLILKLLVGLLVGIVWWHAASPPRLQKIFPMEGAMFILVMNSIVDTLASTLIIFPTQRALLHREYKNGNYSLAPFYLALMLSMGLTSIVYVLFMTVPIFFMVGLVFTPTKFFFFLCIMVSLTCIGNALGVIMGATSEDLVAAQNKLMPTLAPLVLFSGYVIPYNQLNSVYKFFYHISFFQYGLSALQLNQLTDLDFKFSIWDTLNFTLSGNQILKEFSLDPETHHVEDYVLILLGYCLLVSWGGYFLVKYALQRKTG